MRRTLGIGIGIGIGIGRKLPNPSNIPNAAKQTLIPFSTSSGSGRGGGGRGRGRGGSPPTRPIGFIQQESDDFPPDSSVSPVPSGFGHGHGKPIPSSPVRPSFSSPIQPPSAAAGRGRGLSEPSAAGRGQGLGEPSADGRGRGLSEPSAAGRGRGLSEPSAAGPGQGLSEPSADGRGRGLSEPSAAGRGRGLSEPSAAGRGQGLSEPSADGRGRGFSEPSSAGRGRGFSEPSAAVRGQGLSEPSAAGRGRGLSEASADGRGRGLSEPSAAGRGRGLSEASADGRGRGLSEPSAAGPHSPQVEDTGPMSPNFFKREERSDTAPSKPNIGISDSGVSILPEGLRASFGSGRGKPMKQPVPETEIQQEQENRHLRAQARSKRAPKMSREEAVQHAVRVLTQGDGESDGVASGRGMRGTGRGRWGDGGRGWGDRRKGDKFGDAAAKGGLYLGNNVDGEKLARKLGPQIMNKLAEGFEEMSDKVLPSPLQEAYLDALHTNLSIELEPEFHMGDLQTNPDIDEKPPIPLRDALEKMKPFLMAYEGIQSHEEWEEIMKETMEKVPLLKEIVDHYSGEDRVTAMEQQRELERVVKTVPASAPVSVMRFTERAAHILQSNPGWKFGQKCEFMDRLVGQVSQQYK